MNLQIKDIEDKINKLEENKKELKKSMNPFNRNFNINRNYILIKINFLDKEIFNLKQNMEKLKVFDYPKHLNPFENEITPLFADDIISINSEQFIEMQYGNKCCPPCTIL
ncbi:hypothetical protein [Spiroplasma endosymbiont of Virgichneumon dumeticola]|uniref:hypothetical protein n=1 Tax=Spiroplasma endosymbiont of Virgichneumon dumeticola TaxID=3139323 RepID=UPI0035C91F5B